MPTTHPAPMKTVLSHVVVPILMGLIMTAAYLGGFHAPKPHHVPVAVVGQAQQAGPVAAKLQQALGDKADVTTVSSVAEATHRLQHLDLAGAYVPGQKSAQALTATGASDSTATAVEKMFRGAAEKQGVPLSVHDVAPVSSHDPIGQNGFFYLVALTVGSYATSIAIGAAGATRHFRDRAALAVGASVVISTLALAIAAGGYDMFGGHVLATWGLSILYTLGVLTIGVGLHPIIGRFSTLVYSAVFVALNFTSSGGVFAPVMQPAFFGWLHSFWIGSGFVEAERRIVYFPDAGIGSQMAILFGWLVFGLLCLGAGYLTEQKRRQRALHEAELANRNTGKHTRRASASHREHGQRLDDDTEEELEENVAV